MPQLADPIAFRSIIGRWRQAFGLARDTFKKVEGAALEQGLELPLWSKFGEPIFEGSQRARNWLTGQRVALDKIAKGFSNDESENVMASFLNGGATSVEGYQISSKQAQAATGIRNHIKAMLKESGLDDVQAENFIGKDLARLRELKGDVARFSPHNQYPQGWQPFFEKINQGAIRADTNNPYVLAHDIMNLVSDQKFIAPARATAKAAKAAWEKALKGKVKDMDVVNKVANDYMVSQFERKDELAVTIADKLTKSFGFLAKNNPNFKIDPKTVEDMATNMASFYSGLAMSMRAAPVIRNLPQGMFMPALKVGFREIMPAYKKMRSKEWAQQALKDINMDAAAQGPGFMNPFTEGPITNKLFRNVRAIQNIGFMPFRWSDRSHNRVLSYTMGHNSVESHGRQLLSGKQTWDEFIFNTGLVSSPKVDQLKLKAMLVDAEVPNLERAAREYGKILTQDTQYIYDSVNSPMMFKGVAGKLFGQFGIWPIGFVEYMWQNMAHAPIEFQKKFFNRYVLQKGALLAAGAGLGVDTSSWNYANPLTFQGGPWFQALRDTSVLATSQNEFERRKARGNVRRMVSHYGTPFTGIINPLGGATTDVIQAMEEEDPMRALALSLGFNLQDVSPATRR
jgi:hypothetical protein